MFSNFHEAEIALQKNWIIIRQDALLDKADLLDFLMKFNPLINEYICVFIFENGNSNGGDIYYWLKSNGLKPLEDFYISNNLAFECEEKDYPRNPFWVKIYKEEGILKCDFTNTKSYFYSSEFNKHNKK